jgi:outer membrane protein TolC
VRFSWVLVALVATPFAPRADTAVPPPRAIDLRAAIDHARAHQPDAAVALARVAEATARADAPRAAWSPRIGAGAQLLVGTANNTTASFGGGLPFDIPRIGGTPANADVEWGPEPSTLVGVGVRQQLYDFGRISLETRAAELALRAARADAETVGLDVALLVEEAFYAVQGAHAVLDAAQAAVIRARAHRDYANAQVTAQLRPPIELTRAEADLARRELDVMRARGSLAVAQQRLAAAVGSTEPALDAGRDDLSWSPPASHVDANRRIEQRPDLRAAQLRVDAQRAFADAIAAELRPSLALSATLTGRAGGAEVAAESPTGDGWLPAVPNWDAFVSLSFPIFDRTVTARARIANRRADVHVAELAGLRLGARVAVARAYADLALAEASLPALQRALDAATANHDQAEARYGKGLATAVELSDAEALLTDAQIQLAVGRFQRARARALLARVIGEERR